MKALITSFATIVCALLACADINAQCDTLRHNNTWFDGWISCEESASPNPVRGGGHWIQYDLGQSFTLFELRVWNMNAPDILDYGVRDVVIDMSVDGETWTEFGQYTVPQASGDPLYPGDEILNFDSAQARFVLITAIDNYGGQCYGLSEVRIRAHYICPENKVKWIAGDGDWDKPENWCAKLIPTELDDVIIPPDVKVTIPEGYTGHCWNITLEDDSWLDMRGNLVVHRND